MLIFKNYANETQEEIAAFQSDMSKKND